MFRKRKNLDYQLSFNKLAFTNALTNAANVYRYLVKDSVGEYFIFCDLIHTLKYRDKMSELEFNCMLKVPVSVPFEKMDGLGLLQPESKKLEAIIDFNQSKVIVMESFSPFYQMVKVLKQASGEIVEKTNGIVAEYEVNEQGLESLLMEFESKDEIKKDTESWSNMHFQRFREGFVEKEFIKIEFERFSKYKKRVKHLYQ